MTTNRQFGKTLVVGLVSMIFLSACVKKDYLVTISTEYGVIKAVLFDQTPNHKETFLRLAQQGAYDSTIFHRVMKDFMIQGGDINRKPGIEAPVETLIDSEIIPGFIHIRGMLAGARTPDRINPEKKSGTQFYIVQGVKLDRAELEQRNEDEYYAKLVGRLNQIFQSGEHRELLGEIIQLQENQDLEGVKEKVFGAIPIIESQYGQIEKKTYTDDQFRAYSEVGGAPWLDGEYTIFGQVVEGLDVVDKIAAVEVAHANQPVQDIYLTVAVELLPKSRIEKTYNFQYPQTSVSED